MTGIWASERGRKTEGLSRWNNHRNKIYCAYQSQKSDSNSSGWLGKDIQGEKKMKCRKADRGENWI
jgi:hypothetical protein